MSQMKHNEILTVSTQWYEGNYRKSQGIEMCLFSIICGQLWQVMVVS